MESWIKNKKILFIISIIIILMGILIVSAFMNFKIENSRTKLRNKKFIE